VILIDSLLAMSLHHRVDPFIKVLLYTNYSRYVNLQVEVNSHGMVLLKCHPKIRSLAKYARLAGWLLRHIFKVGEGRMRRSSRHGSFLLLFDQEDVVVAAT